jgi:hypothetical protein
MSPLYNERISTCCATQGQTARMPNGGALERLDTAPLLPPTKTPPDPRLSRHKVAGRASTCACGGSILGPHCAHTADMTRRLNQRKNPRFALPAPAALSALAAHKWRELHAVSVDNRQSRLFLSTWADGRPRRLKADYFFLLFFFFFSFFFLLFPLPTQGQNLPRSLLMVCGISISAATRFEMHFSRNDIFQRLFESNTYEIHFT